MSVIDKDKTAKWYVNRTQYRFPHGARPGVNFEPGEPTKIIPDEWIKGQEVIVEVPDPNSTDEPLPATILGPTPLQKAVPGVGDAQVADKK